MSGQSTFVLGGARSGKSHYGEKLVEAGAGDKVYIATGQGRDDEMKARIAAHQARRGLSWTTIEAPLDVCKALAKVPENSAVLLDCVTLWVSNMMAEDRNIVGEVDRFCLAVKQFSGDIVIVSNEVGLGIVPDNALARRFRDEAGRANQMIADCCDRVVFVAAGQALVMKG
jgi:adenosylcobinamide kinase/adenosylcobinamide-phosphate guanylyltransferase